VRSDDAANHGELQLIRRTQSAPLELREKAMSPLPAEMLKILSSDKAALDLIWRFPYPLTKRFECPDKVISELSGLLRKIDATR
jgi:hypothetical protein